jgi:ABC-type nickel/cobalt efflux system permease component RcnA
MKFNIEFTDIPDSLECYLRWVIVAILIILWTWFLYIISRAMGVGETKTPAFAEFLTFISFIIVWGMGCWPVIRNIVGKYF